MALGPLALGAANPLLLSGVGLVAVPVLIHWLSRRRFLQLPWGAMRFLLEAERENRRRLRLEQLLLLALRCLAMALLALLVARPFAESGIAAWLNPSERIQRVILIDDSASMGRRIGDTTALARAKLIAHKLLERTAEVDPAAPVTLRRTTDPNGVLFGPTPLADALPAALAALGALQETALRCPDNALTALAADSDDPTELHVLSDFQASDWRRGDGAVLLAAWDGLDPDRSSVVLWHPPAAATDNVAITALRTAHARLIAGLPEPLRVRVTNHGESRRDDLNLRVEIEGRALPAAAIPLLAPGATVEVVLEAAFLTSGIGVIDATINADDALPLDDRRVVAADVTDALPVLLVNGAPELDARRDAAHLAARALAPPGQFSSGIEVTVLDAAELATVSLAGFDCVLLCNVEAIGHDAQAALRRFVEDGGGLGIFLGEPTPGPIEFADFTGVTLDGVMDLATAPVRMIRTGAHSVTAALPDEREAAGPTIWRAWRCRPAASHGAAVLARFTDAESSPAIIEQPVGSGRVITIATTANLEWNDWAAASDGSYVVTLLELVRYLAAEDVTPASITAGESLGVRVDPTRFQPTVRFRFPDYPVTPAREATPAEVTSALGEPLDVVGPTAIVAGVHLAELTPYSGPPTLRPICVNADARESELVSLSDAELVAALPTLVPTLVTFDEADRALGRAARRELWPMLLALLGVVLLAEQVCAWWFGRVASERATRITLTEPR